MDIHYALEVLREEDPHDPLEELERENSCAQGKNVETSTMLLFKVAPKKDTVRFDKPNPSKKHPTFPGCQFFVVKTLAKTLTDQLE